MKYYLTIERGREPLVTRKPFDDYAAALAACYESYEARSPRSVLTFTTEVINGQFARTFTELNRPESIDPSGGIGRLRYSAAAKCSNAFEYDDSLFFLIESDIGIADTDAYEDDDDLRCH